MALLYLDSSAVVKLIVREAESEALIATLAGWPERFSSALAKTEVLRAARRTGHAGDVRRAEAVLARITLLRIDDGVLSVATRLRPPALRTLDAIHLASALSVGADLGAIVTYDAGLRRAAVLARVTVLAPGRA